MLEEEKREASHAPQAFHFSFSFPLTGSMLDFGIVA